MKQKIPRQRVYYRKTTSLCHIFCYFFKSIQLLINSEFNIFYLSSIAKMTYSIVTDTNSGIFWFYFELILCLFSRKLMNNAAKTEQSANAKFYKFEIVFTYLRAWTCSILIFPLKISMQSYNIPSMDTKHF